MTDEAITNLRKEYSLQTLDESSADPDPFTQFDRWFQQMLNARLDEPNAVVFSTVGLDGRPSARMVLLKGLDERGFVFFTNYESRKSKELQANPRAALLFHWGELERQVRIEGAVERTSAEESDEYFQTRPRESQISAWASRQSSVIPNREALERQVEEMRKRYEGRPVPRPPFWGGLRLLPETFEFWHGRPNRLHDRLLYTQKGQQWIIQRLSP